MLDFVHFVCYWCHVHVAFPFSHVVVSFVFACCLGLLYLILGSRTVVSASRSHRLRCLSYRSIQFAVMAVHLMLWEEQQQVLHPSHEVDGFMPSPHLAGCPLRMHRGHQPALGRHRPVSILVETSACCCRGSRHICQQVSLSPPGGSPGGARRVKCVGWHSWPGWLVLTAMGAPRYSSRPRQLSQRSRTVPRAEETSLKDFSSGSIWSCELKSGVIIND